MDPFNQKPQGVAGFFHQLKSLFSSQRKPVINTGFNPHEGNRQSAAHQQNNYSSHAQAQAQHAAGQAGGYQSHQAPGFIPRANQSSQSRAKLQVTLAIIVALIPVTFYVLQSDKVGGAIASIGGKKGMPPSSPMSSSRDTRSQNADNAAMKVADNSTAAPTESVQDVMDDSALEHAGKHANPNYICPMHPDVVTDDPNAICPICGMDLVLLESGGDVGVVKLTPSVINSLGVRTTKVKRRTLYRRIDSVGYINVDENNMRSISLRTDGWMERMVVKTEGERVTKGQLLFEIYSPTLVNAQEEYIQAMHHDNDLLLNASRKRLLALGVSVEQIQMLETTLNVEDLVKVFAPQSGIVSALRVREGMYVKPSQSIIDLVDLSSVWLMVDVFERQADWVEVGQRAEATLPFMPGKSWQGKVEYVYPSIDASTRSLKVRLRFDNVEEELKPNMYADVTIFAKPKRKVLAIPKESLIVTGNQSRVIVALGEGRFIPMSVGVGMEAGGKVEVTRGLSEGDEVVTSSQFLIDSESSLKASLARMAGGS